MRRNADENLRDLERKAATGDRDALARLFREKQRIGRPDTVTVGEMAATPGPDVVAFMRGLPDELGGRYWSQELERPPGAILPAMTHDEIVMLFDNNRYGTALGDYQRAIEAEAEALAEHFRTGRRSRGMSARYMEQAQNNYAENVSHFLEHPNIGLEPHEVFGNRIRPSAWATAERIREIMRAREAEASTRGHALAEPPFEIEIEGGVLERDGWEIRFRDDDGNAGSVWSPGDEGWDLVAARFGVTRETITVLCPGCGERQIPYGRGICRECFGSDPEPVSPGLARLFRAEVENHEQMLRDGDEPPAPTLRSALESINSGYDPGHGDDMEAVATELRELIALGGDDVLIGSVWDGEVPEPEPRQRRRGRVDVNSARNNAADAAYEDYDFGRPVAGTTPSSGWQSDADVWSRTVFLEDPEGGDSDAVMFRVVFAPGSSEIRRFGVA